MLTIAGGIILAGMALFAVSILLLFAIARLLRNPKDHQKSRTQPASIPQYLEFTERSQYEYVREAGRKVAAEATAAASGREKKDWRAAGRASARLGAPPPQQTQL